MASDPIKEVEALYNEAKAGEPLSARMGQRRALRATRLAWLWGRAGGAKAALRWLRRVLDD